ncbi:MAG: AAA family ATPase [bacterium]|nr:AAA family ATPase [bacterium]
MRTVTFYSYKGGVGRTLALANLAVALARVGQKVFAVDFDLEAPGLHYRLPPEDEHGRGLVDLIHDFLRGAPPPESLSAFSYRVAAPSADDAEIRLMPAGLVPRSPYWRRLAQISWHDLFYTEGAPGVALFFEIKERIRREYNPDYLLIDARTGVTELGGVATSLLADDLVCLLAHNRESLEGSRAVLRSVVAAERPGAGPPARILPVLVRIPRSLDADKEREIVESARACLNEPAEDLAQTLALDRVYVLHSEPDLQVAEQLLVEQAAANLESPLLEDYFRLFVQLLPPEIAAERLKLLTERRTEYTPVAHRVLVREEPAPAGDGDRTGRWEGFVREIRRLLTEDMEAATTIAGRRDAWQRAFEAGGADGLVEALLKRSKIDEVLVAMNEAFRSLDGRPGAAKTVEDVLNRIVPLLYDRHLVYSLPETAGGVVLQLPVATATVAEILLASVDAGGLDYLPLTDPESLPRPAAAVASLPESGIDFTGDRAFEDFVDHLANAFVSEEDRRALGQHGGLSEPRYRQLLALIDDELAWRSRQAVTGRRTYFLFDSRFARENGPLLGRLRESLPALSLIELTSRDAADEERLCEPLRDFLYHSQTQQGP